MSSDTGQRIFGFGSCQLTTAWMRSIRLHAPTLTRKCKILKNWFPFVADGLVGGRTDGHVTTKFFRTYKEPNFLSYRYILMSDTVLFFAIEQQKVRIITAFLKSFERGLGRVSKWHVCGRWKNALKNPFLQNSL